MNKLHIITAILSVGMLSFTLPKTPSSRGSEERFVDYHENGITQVSANFKKNKLSGTWASWFVSGAKCDSGRFAGSVPDGEWKSWYPNGKVRVVWHFNARKLAGVKDEILRQPKVRQYAIAQKPVEEAVQYYRVEYWYNESVATSAVVTRSGLVSSPAITREELLKRVDNNTVHAIEKYRPPFSEALLHGNYTSYYPDGSVKEEGVFLNGMREGAWEEYGDDGVRWRGNYRHNQKEGEWRKYVRGKLHSFVRYNSRGEVVESHDF